MARVKFGDVVRETKGKVDRNNNPYEFYVAGDHMDSEDLTIHRHGCFATDDVGPAFIREFKRGQVLYGSRRTYLKKVAVADFDGVTANTTFVLETKDQGVLMQKLLPFIMLSEGFTTWSVGKSKGSTNPYVLFSDLADYEFELPPIALQKELSDLLWQMFHLQEQYNRLIKASDELVKSQFIAEFGDPRENPNGYSYSALRGIADITSGITKGRKTKEANLVRVPYICTANVQNGYIDWSETKYIEATTEEISLYSLYDDDVLMIEGGDPDKVGRGCLAGQVPNQCIYQNHVFRVRLNKDAILPEFFARYILLPSTKQYFLECAKQTTGIATINKRQLSDLGVMYPPLNLQKRYLATAQQLDKSKFVVQKATQLLQCML